MNVNPMEWIADGTNFEDSMVLWRRRLRSAAFTAGIPTAVRESWVEDRAQHALTLFVDGKAFPPEDLPQALRRPIAWLRKAKWRVPTLSAGGQRKRAWQPYKASMNAAGDNPSAIAAALETHSQGTAEQIIGTAGRELPAGTVAIRGGGGCGHAQPVMTFSEGRWRMIARRDRYREHEAGTVRDSVTILDRFSGHQPPPPPADTTGEVCIVRAGRRDLISKA